MSSIPVLAGATYFDRYIYIGSKPFDQNVGATELADALPGGSHSWMAPIDPTLFTITVDGRNVPVISVDMKKDSIITLANSIRKNALVKVSYKDPEGNQEIGVLQDDEGDDASSANLVAESIDGYETRLLEGAELGAKYGVSDDEWFFGNDDGFYVAALNDSGGQPDTPITVTELTQNTFTVVMQPIKFFPNPSYSSSALSGFRSYKYSNEVVTIEFLKQGRDIQLGESFTLLDLVDPEKREKFVAGKQSVMVTNNPESQEPERIFDVASFKPKLKSETFWLSLGAWLYQYKEVDFDQIVTGSSFNDEIITGDGNDIVDSQIGDDIVETSGGRDVVNTGVGDDYVKSGDGNDVVNTGDGADVIVGGEGAGNDTYDGGRGMDTIRYTSAAASIAVNLAKGTAAATFGNDAAAIGVDKLKGIENIISGNFADIIIGSKDANSIEGAAGQDTIDGGLGRDTLRGGEDSDVFVFSTKPALNNLDIITDFEAGIDKIQLVSKVFGKLKGATNYLVTGTANTSTHYVIYDSLSGTLSYDADGSGSKAKPVEIAIIGNGLILKQSDFILL